jgi:hypothetical protein
MKKTFLPWLLSGLVIVGLIWVVNHHLHLVELIKQMHGG